MQLGDKGMLTRLEQLVKSSEVRLERFPILEGKKVRS